MKTRATCQTYRARYEGDFACVDSRIEWADIDE